MMGTANTIQGIRTLSKKGSYYLARLESLADAKRALKARVNNEGCYVVTPRIVRVYARAPGILRITRVHAPLNLDFLLTWGFSSPLLPGGRGGTRIMDLDQYLEKMNTNTNVI